MFTLATHQLDHLHLSPKSHDVLSNAKEEPKKGKDLEYRLKVEEKVLKS